ncbi:tyrosine-type recombinase/integrase [Pontibacter korlensis]|uniref:tyrosine-type recombinase/integrase n=1 Tax=Pontibacter korlensis TaxID=400092 RepID=UPI001910E2B2
MQDSEQGLLDRRYTTTGVQWVVRTARNEAGLSKQVTPHTLRHTFATHLLEDGLDIVSIKDLLGHACIDTTMVYLHVAQSGSRKPFSPLDTLYC